ncbi:MAG: hypothetical protein QNJ67_18635 [Kiloniellales bacterium]|nr:hypothetical protein [Kiloniellales bacterium]
MDQEKLSQLVDQAKGRDTDLLLAGLTVLTKDLAEYFAATGHGESDTQLLQGIYSGALGKERERWMAEGPKLFQTLRDGGLPQGFAADAVQNRIDLERLGEKGIVQDWTVGPGRALLEGFGSAFQDTICGKDGPYERLQSGQLGQANLPMTIAGAILASERTQGVFWLPLAVYLGLLISKSTLSSFCQTGQLAPA